MGKRKEALPVGALFWLAFDGQGVQHLCDLPHALRLLVLVR